MSSELKRQLVATLDEVIKVLRDRSLPDTRVHDARKSIKKARSILRLLRESMGEARYKHENATLRDAGRCLSPLRDAKSLAATLAAFQKRFAAKLRPTDFDALSQRVNENLRNKRAALKRSPNALRPCKQALVDCRARFIEWKEGPVQGNEVINGLRRIYRAGRKSLAEARRAHTPEALHEWRKQVKYLSNALKTLKFSGTHIKQTEKRTSELADCLGEDHDLNELARYVSDEAKSTIEASAKKTLLRLTKRRRTRLQKRAYQLGFRTYDDKPARFVARLQESQAKQ